MFLKLDFFDLLELDRLDVLISRILDFKDSRSKISNFQLQEFQVLTSKFYSSHQINPNYIRKTSIT